MQSCVVEMLMLQMGITRKDRRSCRRLVMYAILGPVFMGSPYPCILKPLDRWVGGGTWPHFCLLLMFLGCVSLWSWVTPAYPSCSWLGQPVIMSHPCLPLMFLGWVNLWSRVTPTYPSFSWARSACDHESLLPITCVPGWFSLWSWVTTTYPLCSCLGQPVIMIMGWVSL